jgi:nitroreductase/NAD-dependent dihydropyrimidine dehydrogenase PreA subunit
MNIRFNYDICTGCSLCSKACGSKRIEMGPDDKPYKIIELGCNDCGHCIAVCPVSAIENTRVDMSAFTEMSDPAIRFEQFIHLVRNRRSIRNFKKEQLSKEHIDKLLEAVRYIPTGSNKQSLKYKFITDRDLLVKISKKMACRMRRVSKLINLFPVRYFVREERRRSLKRLTDLFYQGDDTFLRGAPCLLVIYTEEKYFTIPKWDAGIASNTIDLAAQTLGIATLMNGYFVILANRYKSIRNLAQMSGKQTILTAICLGYPEFRYKKTVFRRPLDVSII